VHRPARHHAGRLELESATALGHDLAQTIDRLTEGVDHPAQEVVTNRDREDLARALDLLALLDTGEVTEDDDADLVSLKVQRDTQSVVCELQQLVGHRRGQALDVRNAVTGVDHSADLFAGGRAGLVRLNKAVQRVPDLLRTDRELRHQCLSPRMRPEFCSDRDCRVFKTWFQREAVVPLRGQRPITAGIVPLPGSDARWCRRQPRRRPAP